jgi:pimeloyl-ACP methyl ester carboxylesterase
MKLAYLDLALDSSGPPALLLHREGITSTADAVAFAQGSGLFGRAAVPTGEYAFYPSGMSIGGTCWYRMLPGFEGTDPISLTTAVVEVADLLDDLGLDRPVLLGWGQGAVVALAAGVWRSDAVGAVGAAGAVVCVDPNVRHLELLPAAVLATPSPPPVLLVASGAAPATALEQQEKLLASHNIGVSSWCWSGEGTTEDFDRDLADRIGRWMEHE